MTGNDIENVQAVNTQQHDLVGGSLRISRVGNEEGTLCDDDVNQTVSRQCNIPLFDGHLHMRAEIALCRRGLSGGRGLSGRRGFSNKFVTKEERTISNYIKSSKTAQFREGGQWEKEHSHQTFR